MTSLLTLTNARSPHGHKEALQLRLRRDASLPNLARPSTHMSSKTVQAVRESLQSHNKSSLTDEDVEALARENAALTIQRAWRAKKRASYLGNDFLWTDLITHARFQVCIPFYAWDHVLHLL
jgi:hypothetical protein